MWRCLRHKPTTNAITVLSSGRSFRRRGKEMERDTERGRREGWEGVRSLSKKRSFLDRWLHCIIVCFHRGSCWRTFRNVALPTFQHCCHSKLFIGFVFVFVVFMKADSIICSLGVKWGQWNYRTQLFRVPLLCTYFPRVHFCTMHKNTHLTLTWIHGLFFLSWT